MVGILRPCAVPCRRRPVHKLHSTEAPCVFALFQDGGIFPYKASGGGSLWWVSDLSKFS